MICFIVVLLSHCGHLLCQQDGDEGDEKVNEAETQKRGLNKEDLDEYLIQARLPADSAAAMVCHCSLWIVADVSLQKRLHARGVCFELREDDWLAMLQPVCALLFAGWADCRAVTTIIRERLTRRGQQRSSEPNNRAQRKWAACEFVHDSRVLDESSL